MKSMNQRCIILLMHIVSSLTRLTEAQDSTVQLLRSTVSRALFIPPPTDGSTFLATSDRSGPLGNVFRVTLTTTAGCKPNKTHTCRPASTAFGLVGDARYTFNDANLNVMGQSVMSMRICVCLQANCSEAINMMPVGITDAQGDVIGHTVLYERESTPNGRFSDCFGTVARVDAESRFAKQPNVSSIQPEAYQVDNDVIGDHWSVVAHRGWTTTCSLQEVAKLPLINLSTITSSEGISNSDGVSLASPCRPRPGMKLYKSGAEESKLAIELYDKAIANAIYQSKQQDCFGNGKSSQTYLTPPSAELASPTDLTLACSAAILGVLLLMSMCRDWIRNYMKKRLLCFFLTAQLLYVFLETLPLFVVLATELQAQRWSSILAWIDVALAGKVEGDNDFGVMIFTIVVGDLKHEHTNVLLTGILTAFFIGLNMLVAIYVVTRTLLSDSGVVINDDVDDNEECYLESGFPEKKCVSQKENDGKVV